METLCDLRLDSPYHLESVFHMCDEEQKGYLTSEDLKVAFLYIFGYKPSKQEVKQMMTFQENFDHRHMDIVCFQRTIKQMATSSSVDQDIRQLFQLFDVKCQGFLTLDDINQGFKFIMPCLKDSVIIACFQVMCSNNFGKLSYKDFEKTMKHSNCKN